MRAASDREALQLLAGVVGRPNSESVTCVWLRNTLELSKILVTENLLTEQRDDLHVAGPAYDWDFDAAGDIRQSII
ncbi:MAG: hypothetical protein WKF37_08745 [Bryobacteraceae bacterium]